MIAAWVIFIVFVLIMLALDLGVFHRKSHAVSIREAIGWSVVWITLGLSFSVLVYFAYENHWCGLGYTKDAVDHLVNDGRLAATKYLTGYVVEKSLSVDNIFVIAMIFSALKVRARYQHRVLYWGILGALVMRGAMIGVGTALINEFHWILYIFGVFLIFTGLKMFKAGEEDAHDAEDHFLTRWLRKIAPITKHYHGKHFLIRAGSEASHQPVEPGEVALVDPVVENAKKGALLFTPLAVALVLVEFTDLIFAVDSIPAIFAITTDPFLVFTSNVFAILGLRSLYFALAGIIDKFRYLKPALALILIVVGSKMLAAKQIKDMLGESFNFVLLGVILGILAAGVVTSIVVDRKKQQH